MVHCKQKCGVYATKYPPPETLRPHRANRPHRAKRRAVSVRMTPPPPHNCVFGGTPHKTKNAAPLPLCGARVRHERLRRGASRPWRVRRDSMPHARKLSPADEIRYPRNAKSQVHPKKARLKQPAFAKAQRGNNPHGVPIASTLTLTKSRQTHIGETGTEARNIPANDGGNRQSFSQVRDNARGSKLDAWSVPAVRQFSRTNIHPVPGKVKSAFFAEKAPGGLKRAAARIILSAFRREPEQGFYLTAGPAPRQKAARRREPPKRLSFFMGACRFA